MLEGRTFGPFAGWKPAVQVGASMWAPLWTAGFQPAKRRKPWFCFSTTPGQPHGRDRLHGYALAAPGESKLL